MPIIDPFVKNTLKEIIKHAERDDCYNCKQLLREFASRLGVDPKKLLEDLAKT